MITSAGSGDLFGDAEPDDGKNVHPLFFVSEYQAKKNGITENAVFASNFHPSPITIGAKCYSTVEHAYVALRVSDEDEREEIRRLRYPSQAKAHVRRSPIEVDSVALMRMLTREKYRQNPDLAKQLLETDERELVHWAPWDEFWGNGRRGAGKNMQGLIVMEVRQELRAEALNVVQAAARSASPG